MSSSINLFTAERRLAKGYAQLQSKQSGDAVNRAPCEKIEDELADTLFFVLRFAQMNGIDLGWALERKIAKNAMKYPVEVCRSDNRKR